MHSSANRDLSPYLAGADLYYRLRSVISLGVRFLEFGSKWVEAFLSYFGFNLWFGCRESGVLIGLLFCYIFFLGVWLLRKRREDEKMILFLLFFMSLVLFWLLRKWRFPFGCWEHGGKDEKMVFFSSKFMFLCCLLRKLRKFCERVIFFNLFHIMTDSSPQFSFSFYSYASFYQVGIVRGFWTYPMDGQFSVVLPNVSFLRKI